MREGPQDQQPLQRHSQSGLSLSGLSLSRIEGDAVRQLHQMEAVGAQFAEKLSTPVSIRNPLPDPMDTAIITTRWLGGGVFGVLFPFQNGEVISGWISITNAMKANPGLTPSGTFSSERWDKNIFSCRDHLLPKPDTITQRVRAVARELMVDLLQEFPYRIDLSPELNTTTKEHTRLSEIHRETMRSLSKELADGLKVASRTNPDDAKLHKLLLHIVDSQVKQALLLQSLKLFRETRMHRALTQYEQGEHSGIIHDLMKQTVTVSAMLLSPYVRTALVKNPFATLPNRDVQSYVGIGLAICMATQREFAELWKHLTSSERGTIVAHISEKARRKAVSTYAQNN